MGLKFKLLKGKKGIQKVYNMMAKDYDKSKYLFWTRKFEYFEEKIIKKWLSEFKGVVCDIGCGTGRYSLKLLPYCDKLIALDFSKGMLTILRGKIKSSKISVIVGDGENLPFRDDSIDGIICTLALDHFSSHESGIKEFHRVLKNGAMCVISIFNRRTMEEVLKMAKIPYGYIPFRTENCPPALIEEKFLYHEEAIKILSKYFKIVEVKGCCYWHIFPFPHFYFPFLDKMFNRFKKLIKFAEIFTFKLEKI